MPRGTVTEPIDDELLFEELRAQEDDSRPERPLSKRKVGAPTIAWVRGAVESQAGAYCEYVESTLAAQRFMRARRLKDSAKPAELDDGGVRDAVSALFSPAALRARVEEELGEAPPELEHAPLVLASVPTLWYLFRAEVSMNICLGGDFRGAAFVSVVTPLRSQCRALRAAHL